MKTGSRYRKTDAKGHLRNNRHFTTIQNQGKHGATRIVQSATYGTIGKIRNTVKRQEYDRVIKLVWDEILYGKRPLEQPRRTMLEQKCEFRISIVRMSL